MEEAVQVQQYILIKLGNEQYGINIQNIQNIVKMLNVTRVPKAPQYIKGVINLRGDIIPVMSMRCKFKLEEDIYTNDTRIIIIKLDEHLMGIIVDKVIEVIQLAQEDIEKVTKDINDDKRNYIQGVGKLGKDLVTLLNLNELINEQEI